MSYMDYGMEQELMGESPPEAEDFSDTNVEEGEFQDEAETGEAQEKPKRGRKKKSDQPEDFVPEDVPDEFPPQEDDFDEGAEADSEPDSELPQSEGEPRRVRARPRRVARVLDGEGNLVYEQFDSGQHDISMLMAAKNSRKILSATLDGFEADGETMPKVVFYVGTVKVMIPFREMGFDLDPDNTDRIEARLAINRMIGAKIFYMVRGVDLSGRLAGASRRDAMVLRRRTILNARNSNGRFRIREGVKCTAQVLHVSRRFVRVEIYGMETDVYIGDISNLWINDIREVINPGEERPVEIKELERDELGRAVWIRASLKLAEEKPTLELQALNTYTGTITGFSETAYFVKVAGVPIEVRCPLKSSHTMELLEPGDLVKFYVPAIYLGVPTGAILKILKKARDTGR